jgi:phosphatidylglycerophosphate synthase
MLEDAFMDKASHIGADSWKTKSSDRFILKWIKLHLSSHVTLMLYGIRGLKPWMITVFSAGLGIVAGGVFALGLGWGAALIAALAQILDGVDGQFARLTNKESPGGAFLDSVLDRYADGAMVMGLAVYMIRLPAMAPLWLLLALSFFALVGSNLISFTSARAENLDLHMGKPTLASKGTRMSTMILGALGTLVWPYAPVISLCYLAVHPNAVVVRRLLRAAKSP